MPDNTPKSAIGLGINAIKDWGDGSIYFKPVAGIPKNDLEQSVKNSLNLANSSLQSTDVVDDVNTQASNKPLSARVGYELQAEINNLKARGRFLSLWNCVTGLPSTNPVDLPYSYKAGDYYIVSTVGASGNTNYMPIGSFYNGSASTIVETLEVKAGDFYEYDGTSWLLLFNTQKTVSFSQIAGNPTDNQALSSALNGKANTSHSHTTSDVTGLQNELNGKADSVHSHQISDVTGLQDKLDEKANASDVQSALEGKQNTLTFDDTPTQNSNNPVKSGGVYNFVKGKISNVWENSNPSSDFDAQILTFSNLAFLPNFLFIVMQGGVLTSSAGGEHLLLCPVDNQYHEIYYFYDESDGNYYNCQRDVKTYYDGSLLKVSFSTGHYHKAHMGSGMWNNSAKVLIPQRIIGIKI